MLQVTDKAKEELKNLFLLRTGNAEASIRLAYGSLGQFGFILSQPKEGDEVIRDQDGQLLLVGSEFKNILSGATFDVEYNDGKREFVMIKK
jgi:hypothetical protein